MRYYIRPHQRNIDNAEEAWLALPRIGPAQWVRANGSLIRQYRIAHCNRPRDLYYFKKVYAPGYTETVNPDLVVDEGL